MAGQLTDEADGADLVGASERSRERRRERRYSAQEREMMSTGPAKVFAQILRRIADDAAETPAERKRRKRGTGARA